MKNNWRRFSFVSNLLWKDDFCNMFSLKFSRKFESYNFQHCKKELPEVSFLYISRKPTALHFLWAAILLLQKSFINHYLQKSETKVFKQKRFHKKLAQSQREKKNSCILRLNKIMSKLLTLSKCMQSNC